ncbi:PREDICTED: myelin-associated glycoprotein-like isoform X1 [Cyprinodon variegatus]|nr:PREDICTED: myelin-associated glycoprotein-like isoform X1 [Cyprinodon variegatus]
MGASKLLIFCFFIYLKGSESETSWTSKSPASVKGLLGSCVVIPCSFNFPDKGRNYDSVGIWYDPNGVVFHSKVSQKVSSQYKGRTELVGDLKEKNCSLKIVDLQEKDTGPFDFRIEIKDYDSYYYKSMVSISAISEPNPIQFSVSGDFKERHNLSASCSVFHTCPASPPHFTWSHSGKKTYHSQQLNDGEWKETAILNFRLTHNDHNKALKCSVKYNGGKVQEKQEILQVRYAPVNVKVEYNSTVMEGENVSLICSSEAHPPVTSYHWHSETGANISQGNLYMVTKVSRNIRALYCIAVNEEGQGISSPAQLNVLYAPEVKTESSCFSQGNNVKCQCVVDSNPPSEVTFKLSDQILPNATRMNDSSFVIMIPWKDVKSSTFVQCWAENKLGKASLKLFLHDGMEIYIFIAIGAAGFLVMILLGVIVIKKCRGTPCHTSGSDRNTMVTQSAWKPHYNSKRKEFCNDSPISEICPNYIYGNVLNFGDDQIYANV